MQRGERDLARADEVEVVLGDLGRSAARCRAACRCRRAPARGPARAGSRARSRGRAASPAPSAPAPARGTRVRPAGRRSASRTGRAPRLHVDQLAGQLEVVLRREPGSKRSPTSRRTSSSARRPSGRAGSAARRAPARARPRPSAAPRSAPSPVRPPRASWRSQRPRRPPSFFARAMAWLASFCCARRPSISGSSARRRSSSRRTASTRVGDVPSAARQGGAHGIGVLADQPQIEHRPDPTRCGGSAASAVAGWRAAASPCPAYSARKSATFSASSPVTMFSGMTAPEKPPLRIA